MGSLVRIRLAMADRPGSLARVAASIAEHGGNIVSVDVHRAGVVSAVDDLVVDFADEAGLTALRDSLTSNGAATLLSVQAAHPTDPVVGALERAAAMVGSDHPDPEVELVASVAELCSSPAAWMSSLAEAKQWEAGRFALERDGAIALRTTELPEDMAERLPGEVWLLAVPDSELLTDGRVIFVARPIGNEFTATEIARIEAVMALHDQVDRLLSAD